MDAQFRLILLGVVEYLHTVVSQLALLVLGTELLLASGRAEFGLVKELAGVSPPVLETVEVGALFVLMVLFQCAFDCLKLQQRHSMCEASSLEQSQTWVVSLKQCRVVASGVLG